MVKSILVKGQEALDAPFQIGPNEVVNDVVVTFTDQITELSGALVDGAGQPVPNHFVLVFPTTPAAWIQGSRRMRSPSRTGEDGRYRYANLPPGEYYMVALTDFDSQELYEPGFLEQVAASSFKITIAEGEKKTLNFKVARQQ